MKRYHQSDSLLQLCQYLFIDELLQKSIIGISDIKANIFNKFFAEQCTPLKNDSALPINPMFLTQLRLGTIVFNENEMLKMIMALNIHKTHGHDDISIRMIQNCDRTLIKPLFYFKIQFNIRDTQIYGKDLTLHLYTKK